ncbi:MAG TPA: RNA 2',3'-cyclic phosphodiesterase [Candidatus Baltobacteraceae bacterium]|nr:RNA 2',3'-cyclic phosphodiesterase [Candidatus Baltobacteraceae bacterium]
MYRPKLFAGIELDAQTRLHCAAVSRRLEAQGVRARFEPPEKLHITLAYLGWVDPERVEAISAAMRSVAQRAPAFTLRLDRVGAFPHERKPRVVFVGALEQGAAFRDVANSLRGAYAEIGFTFEKAAVAHVTIARVKGPHPPVPPLDLEPIRLRVEELALFESLRDGRTTRYEVRERSRLQGAPPERSE